MTAKEVTVISFTSVFRICWLSALDASESSAALPMSLMRSTPGMRCISIWLALVFKRDGVMRLPFDLTHRPV
ncbi:MAG: hypothetical protein U5O39_13045 [Gammaproteobacteria bacterium]|nr:hypothetical protein [Gammaproteobacteria bacterium]